MEENGRTCLSCGSTIQAVDRFCPKCGWDSRQLTADRQPSDLAIAASPTSPLLATAPATSLSPLHQPPTAIDTIPYAPAPRPVTTESPIAQNPWPAAPPPGWGTSNNHVGAVNANVNVTTNVGGPTIVVTHRNTGPGFFVRALWFLCIGWWASALAIVLAYVAVFTIIGLPLAFMIFNRLPTILTLRPRTVDYRIRSENGVTSLDLDHVDQRPWWQRALYFVFVGWWFGAVWLVGAYLIGLLIVTLPLTFWMFNRTSGVMTLQRH